MGIDKDKSLKADATKLRRHAEERLRAKTAELHPPRTEEDMQRLVQELEVHQIELEMQNAELRQAHEELELSRNKYAELYDFAPVGYFTFDARGLIREVNLAGALLLGLERGLLLKRPFISFIADADGREIFSSHLEHVVQRQGMQRCEIRLTGKDGTVIHGQLQSVTMDTSKSKDGYIISSIVDGTVGKQLETEIKDAREYAENIVETVHKPLVVLNSDLKILTANHSFYDIFKVTPEETIGNFIYDLGNRQWDIPKLRVLVEEILPLDTVINGYEVEHDFQGIGRKTILLNARQIYRKDIGSHIILLAMEDITERRQLETEIKDAREYAENIVETVREPLVVLDSDLKILTANHSFYLNFKVTPEETIGNFIYDLGNRQWDIPKLRVLFEEILPFNTRFYGYEVEHDFPGIGRKTMLLNARQIYRKNIGSRIILLAMEDITERKQLETGIKDAREYAENIVETVREPLMVLNSDLKILTANHSFYATFEVTPGATIGNFIYDLGNRQWDIPKLRVLLEEILPQDNVFNGYEVEHDFPGIGRKTIRLNARQIFRKNIGSHIILLAMEDITERKLADELIKRLNTDLAARATELEAANRDLEAFNYTVAHDLRSPLNAISSYCQVIEELYGDKLDEQCNGYLRNVYDGTLRMNGLIEALLNFSQLAHAETRREAVDLSAMAHEVVAMLKQTEPERLVTFLIADGIATDADANLLRVLLDNLLGNALKYTGIRKEAVIEFGTTAVDGQPTYFVRDNGTGFDMADLDKLFAPFRRLPGAEEFRGFGIGLATVERIVKHHGGKVWAEGEPDKGACFYFTLS